MRCVVGVFISCVVISLNMVKRLIERLQRRMVLHFLEKHDMTFCKMCDNLAPIGWGVCDYCSYELEMMKKASYEEAMLG